MTHQFAQELDGLKQRLLAMAGQAEAALTDAVQALVERDDDRARRVREADEVIDDAEMAVDEMAVHLLAKAPLATDLRLITVAMKISRDLERVGDEATTIARRALKLNQDAPLHTTMDLPRMAGLARAMLKDALDAFVQGRPDRAREIPPRDKELDALNRDAQTVLADCMTQAPATVFRCLHLMVVSKCLERIGDHAKNIAEDVVYLHEARDIRHQHESKP